MTILFILGVIIIVFLGIWGGYYLRELIKKAFPDVYIETVENKADKRNYRVKFDKLWTEAS